MPNVMSTRMGQSGRSTASNLAFWERQFMDALLLSCWLTIVIWQPSDSVVSVARGFFLFIAFYLGFMFLVRVFSSRKSRHAETLL